jgi:hypothetical protein
MPLFTTVKILQSKHKLTRGTRYEFDVEGGIARFRTKRKLVLMPESFVAELNMEVLEEPVYMM